MKFQPKIDQFSLTALPLKVYTNNLESNVNAATAFFYKKKEDIYLITNWHVLTGRRWDNHQPSSNKFSKPTEIGVKFFNKKDYYPNKFNSDIPEFLEEQKFPLYSELGKSLWLEHDQYGSRADIAVLKLSLPKEGNVRPINDTISSFNVSTMHTAVSMDVFILGFPKKLYTGNTPIWKRGTIASEYLSPINYSTDKIPPFQIPAFFVDTATYKGMSGAPVIQRSYGSFENMQCERILGTGTKFLGVYSGRFMPDEDTEVQLGIVFKQELIDDIISKGLPGLSCCSLHP